MKKIDYLHMLHKMLDDQIDALEQEHKLPDAQVEKLIADLKTVEGFDYILLDTPPFGIISDTQVLMRHADLITLVIRQNKTAKFILANLFSNLSRLGNKNISWIFNSYDSHDKMDKKSKVYFK